MICSVHRKCTCVLLRRGWPYQCANLNFPTLAFTYILLGLVKTLKNDHVWAASITGADAYIRKLFKTKDVFERRMSAGWVWSFLLWRRFAQKCGQNHCPRKFHFWMTYVAQKTSLLKLPVASIFPCFYLIHSSKKHYTPVNPRSNSRFEYSALALSARLQDTVTKIKRWLCDV